MKILFAGDWHGNPQFVSHLFTHITDLKIDAIVQCGDFGFWEHRQGGKEYLDVVSELATTNSIPIYWVDGNHENFELLEEKYVKGNYNNFVEIRQNLYYIPRGLRWEWDKVSFVGFGGAYSIDKDQRTPFISWWPQEVASQEDVSRATTTADVLVCHDSPTGVPTFDLAPFKLQPIEGALHSRNQLRKVAEVVEPKFIVHGHYHFSYETVWSSPWGNVKVRGLDSDYTASYWPEVYEVLDTDHIPW